MFKGSITALITPFKNGDVDFAAFDKLVEWQIECGTDGVVPCGTTGESPTLSHDEHMQVIERCIKIVSGRIPVIAGTGSNSTREAISLTLHAQKAGANAALVVTPYYNKPSQEGLYQHYKALHHDDRTGNFHDTRHPFGRGEFGVVVLSTLETKQCTSFIPHLLLRTLQE